MQRIKTNNVIYTFEKASAKFPQQNGHKPPMDKLSACHLGSAVT